MSEKEIRSSIYMKVYRIYDDGDDDYLGDYYFENLTDSKFDEITSEIDKLYDKWVDEQE